MGCFNLNLWALREATCMRTPNVAKDALHSFFKYSRVKLQMASVAWLCVPNILRVPPEHPLSEHFIAVTPL